MKIITKDNEHFKLHAGQKGGCGWFPQAWKLSFSPGRAV